jgi:NAD(P)-dependent dehydrogenase (short-subunit alcohol dehydrogenase family)
VSTGSTKEIAPTDAGTGNGNNLLENKVAVISGVGLGIGRSITLAFAREGADVLIAARTEAVLREVAAEVEALGRQAIPIPSDMTRPEDCRRVAEAANDAWGRIDIAVCGAFSWEPVGQFADADLLTWRSTMEANYWANLNLAQAVLPYMRDLGNGRVIMINASASRQPGIGTGAYGGSKAGLLGVTRTLAKELGAWGIRVNSVVPCQTMGPNQLAYIAMQAKARGVDEKVVHDEIAATTALGYITTSEEVADGVVFFASHLSNGVTGQYLHVSGGRWME